MDDQHHVPVSFPFLGAHDDRPLKTFSKKECAQPVEEDVTLHEESLFPPLGHLWTQLSLIMGPQAPQVPVEKGP